LNNLHDLPSLILALGLDITFGDPPNRFHPVAWMGSLIHFAKRFRPHYHPAQELAYGAGLVFAGSLGVASVGYLFQRLTARLPLPFQIICDAALLKATFSLRSLDQAANKVEQSLDSGNLPASRKLLGWSLVSRDTSALDEAHIASATIESVAENASDGLVAPLFYYALGGLPLALVYRFANTADAMLGYHTAEYEWLGKLPARLDDLLNLVPARLTGWLVILAAPFGGGSRLQARRIMQRDASTTASPNAGYPMSAMAGGLGVELEKTGHYRLGAGLRKSGSSDIRRARRILIAVAGMAASFLVLFQFYKMNTRNRLVAIPFHRYPSLLAGPQETHP
jgi:adenosylcobinamide-phosphate synthase